MGLVLIDLAGKQVLSMLFVMGLSVLVNMLYRQGSNIASEMEALKDR